MAAGVEPAGRAEVAARFSKVIRSGRWVAGRRTRLTVYFGALIINLANAVLPGREVTAGAGVTRGPGVTEGVLRPFRAARVNT
jgi:hypothetical protein